MLKLLENMKRSILDRRDGALTLGRRHWLWNELERQHPYGGRVRQAMLGYVVCKETIAAWDSLSFDPADQRLHSRFRALCRSTLLGKFAPDEASEQFVDLDGHAGCVDFSGGWHGLFALWAARAACDEAIHPVPLPVPDLDLTDDEIHPDELDPHYWVSCLRAGGASWQQTSSVEQRRAFWINWLDETFPLGLASRSELRKLVEQD